MAPPGGLSLIIHIAIVIIALIYKGVLSVVGKILGKKNFKFDGLDFLSSKQGESVLRTCLGYSIVALIFVVISSATLLSVRMRLVSASNFDLIQSVFHQGEIAESHSAPLLASGESGEGDVASIKTLESPVTSSLIKIESDLSEEDISSVDSLTDLLTLIGLESSFEYREVLARQFGINDYSGSDEQNKIMLEKVKVALKSNVE